MVKMETLNELSKLWEQCFHYKHNHKHSYCPHYNIGKCEMHHRHPNVFSPFCGLNREIKTHLTALPNVIRILMFGDESFYTIAIKTTFGCVITQKNLKDKINTIWLTKTELQHLTT